MRRREFISGLAGAAAWPLVARAQQAAIPVVGFLGGASAQGYAVQVAAFLQGLSDAGYVVGRNVAIEYRWAEDRYDRLPALAADLHRLKVSVIVAAGGAAARAAKAASQTIPIVFSVGFDPVKAGLVASLNRPGDNLTGVSNLNLELGPTRLEFLHELVPAATDIGVLVNPTNQVVSAGLGDLQAAARALGVQLHVLYASSERDFDTVFASLVKLRAGGLVIASDAFLISRGEQLAALAIRYAVPTIFQYRDFAAVGGVMSYGGSLADSYRTVGDYTGRIVKGEKPADLPVQQSTKVELVINLKTAKALGLTIPELIKVRADEVIE
jgi:putative ABC transport system substrate-binding protein